MNALIRCRREHRAMEFIQVNKAVILVCVLLILLVIVLMCF